MTTLQDGEALGKLVSDVNHIVENMGKIQEDIREIKREFKRDFVTRDEFNPIKSLVYGVVSMVLVSVGGAIIALVVNSQ